MSWHERLTRWARRRRSGASIVPGVAADALVRQIAATSPDCLKVLDAEGRLLWMSATGCALMEIGDIQEVAGRPWADLWAGDGKAAAENALATAKRGGVGRFSGPCATVKGTLKWWEVVVAATSPDHPATAPLLVVSREVTAARESASAQETLALAERVARRDAERAASHRDELLATVAHELRAPLQAVLTWSVFLQSESVDPAAVEAARRIHGAVLHQQGLIESLLEGTHDREEMATMPVDARAAASDVVDGFRQLATAKGLDLHLQTDDTAAPQIAGDPQMVRQIFINVVSNAIKFTSTGGSVEVRISAADPDILVVVRDSGCGITAEFLPRVFDRYSREKGAHAPGGTGLGLFLTRQFVTRLGGEIRCESAGVGQGTTIAMRFPKLVSRATAGPPPARPVSLPPQLAGVRVLLASSPGPAFDSIADALRHFGARVFRPEQVGFGVGAAIALDGVVADLDYTGLDRLIAHARQSPVPPWVLALALDRAAARSANTTLGTADAVIQLPVPPRLLARAIADLQARAASLSGASDASSARRRSADRPRA